MDVLLEPMTFDHEQLISNAEGHARLLEDPDFRTVWAENALARSIGLSIGAYRQRHGLTQTELGARVGMSQSQVARLERMEHTPSFETLLRLADALGLKIEIAIEITVKPANLSDCHTPMVVSYDRVPRVGH